MEYLSDARQDLLEKLNDTRPPTKLGVGECLGERKMKDGLLVTKITLLALTVLLVFGLNGCLFSPRTPDGPPDESEIPWQTPVTTSIVLANLKAAVEGEGSANYMDCFTDTFRFHVDPQDSLDAGLEGEARYANWMWTDEEQAVSGIFAAASNVSVSFTVFELPDESQDETFRRDDYVLTIDWASGQHVDEQITYKGRVTLHMRKTASRWAIYRWVDRRTFAPEDFETWGVVRGDYRN